MTDATKLGGLLRTARSAPREDRIQYRDQIVTFGAQAVEPMREWLTEPELGAFAVRVLERVAVQPADRRAVIEALSSVDLDVVPVAVARDVRSALDRLVPARANAVGAPARATKSDYRPTNDLEARFHQEMLAIYDKAGEATRKRRPDGTYIRGYWATYFLRGVRNHGGLPYAKRLLEVDGTTDGFARLQEENRLDLTMEALVLKPEYRSLFNAREIQTASSRLARAGFQPATS